MSIKSMIHILDIVFWALGLCVLAIVFFRYTHSSLPGFFQPYALCYLGFFGIASVLQAYIIFFVHKKTTNLLSLVPFFAVLSAVVVAGNNRISGGFFRLVIIAYAIGFAVVFIKLVSRVYSHGQEKIDSEF